MHFYRSWSPVKAITFDLDDTLYANQSVITLAEEASLGALQQYHETLHQVSHEDYQKLRIHLSQQHPNLVDDLTELRRLTLFTLLKRAGLSSESSERGRDKVMRVFHHWRNKVDISSSTHRLLAQLANRIPLIAITNGNACLDAMGIAHYFQRIYRAGQDGRAKPWPDLFAKAAQDLKLPPLQILHVGDNLQTDVAGAIQQGYQACWYNHRGGQSLRDNNLCRLLPHLEITHLSALATLNFATVGVSNNVVGNN